MPGPGYVIPPRKPEFLPELHFGPLIKNARNIT